ncbi:MAG: hypothetical protein WAZ27_01145 [Minisyncoccia bacterium]
MNLSIALIVITVLTLASLGIIVAFTVHPPFRKALPFYDPVADWVGHGIPDIGMLYMTAVMAGLVTAFVPFQWCSAFFLLSALVFAVRIGTGASFVWWQDVLHLAGVLFKAYMFVSVVYWHEIITAHAIIYFVGVIFLYVYRTYVSMQTVEGISLGRFLFNLEHIAMSIPAILMFAMMQWPTFFPIEGGVLCIDPSATIRGHKH